MNRSMDTVADIQNTDTLSTADARAGFPELMTEDELIRFLRIPLVTRAEDHHHVIEHLKRMRGLPCIYISKRCLYPLTAIRQWIQRQVDMGQGK